MNRVSCVNLTGFHFSGSLSPGEGNGDEEPLSHFSSILGRFVFKSESVSDSFRLFCGLCNYAYRKLLRIIYTKFRMLEDMVHFKNYTWLKGHVAKNENSGYFFS